MISLNPEEVPKVKQATQQEVKRDSPAVQSDKEAPVRPMSTRRRAALASQSSASLPGAKLITTKILAPSDTKSSQN